MTVIADLHLHSRFSRAVSQQMTIPNMSIWAKKKEITLLATADWTHPVWLSELKGSLEEDGSGLLRHKGETADDATRFLLASEISSIYSAGGRVRRIHTIMVVPSFAVVEKVNTHLSTLGVNLSSDGRPIMGVSCRDLLHLLLDIDSRNYLIPAHVWTPWFSLYGSNSGFDSIDECFGDVSKEIFVIETGLSSDCAMNWRIAELDSRSIVSFSDAHSLQKMGRELTILESDLTYDEIKTSIKDGNIRGTIEFYPEEGKYHWTGHRNCGVRQSPQETRAKGTICPTCGRPLTVGVEHRVDFLASRSEEELGLHTDTHGWIRSKLFPKRPPYRRLVPLYEILGEALGTLPKSQKVALVYDRLVETFGGELTVLIKTPLEDLKKVAEPRVVEGIDKVRRNDIVIDPGFDGEYGKVKIWQEDETSVAPFAEEQQIGLF